MSTEQGARSVPDPAEFRHAAGEIYRSVQNAGGLHTPRTISITDVANGETNSNDEGLVVWREIQQTLDFSRYRGINLPTGYQWYHDIFEEETLENGFIIFKKYGLKPRGSTQELLVVSKEGEYQVARYDSARKTSQLVEVSLPRYEELFKIIENIDVLCGVPQTIVDLFGTYDQFLRFLIQALGTQPQPGIVTSNYEGERPSTIFGEDDDTNLPHLVKSLSASEKRKKKCKKNEY